MSNIKLRPKLTLILILGLFVCRELSSQNLIPYCYEGISKNWGFKDSLSGKIKIYWHFSAVEPFDKSGLAKVKYKDKYGFIDTLGNIVVPIIYWSTGPGFINDTLLIHDSRGKIKYIRDSIGSIWELLYDQREWDSDKRQALKSVKYFKYPEDNELVEKLRKEQLNKLSRLKPELEEVFIQTRGQSFIGLSTLFSAQPNNNSVQRDYYYAGLLGINIEQYFHPQVIGGKSVQFGLGAGYHRIKYNADTANYKRVLLTLDFVNKFYLGKSIFLKAVVSPIIGSSLDYKKVGTNLSNQEWRELATNYVSSRASYSIGMGFKISGGVEIQFDYRYLPKPIADKKIQTDYFSVSMRFKVN